MGRYISTDDVLTRYSDLEGYGKTVINSSFIYYVEAELDGLLAGPFTSPFSSNNVTIKDLTIDMSYLKVAKLKTSELTARRKLLMDRIQRLRDGSEFMVTTSGDTLVGNAGGLAVPQSNTQDYHNVFNRHDTEDSFTDPDQLDDEDSERDIFGGHNLDG